MRQSLVQVPLTVSPFRPFLLPQPRVSPPLDPEQRRGVARLPRAISKGQSPVITIFRINTYKSDTKQTTLTSFRINTYKKTGGRGVPCKPSAWNQELTSCNSRNARHVRHVACLSPVASFHCAYFPSPRACTSSLAPPTAHCPLPTFVNRLQPLPSTLENARCLLVKQHKINGFERASVPQMLRRLLQHDLRAVLHRESRDPRAHSRERNRLQPALYSKPQRVRRGAPQRLRRGEAAQPHARRVNHVLGRELAASGDDRIPHGDPANGVALALDRIPALAADRARNSSAQNEFVVCGVHNRVRIHLRQVTLLDHDSRCNFLHALPAHRDSVNSLSGTTLTSLPIRRPTSRHRAMVSSEVWSVETNSSAFDCPSLKPNRKPMQRSGQNVTAANSAIESAGELLAKTASGLANLSKMVNISIFISISSATASTIRSPARTASSILLARTSRERASAPTFAPSAIHVAARSSLLSETSSRTVRYPASSTAQAIPRPWSPAPITAMVWISLAISVRVTRCAVIRVVGALIPRNGRINLCRPAIDSAGQRFRARHSLAAQPVMAVANHFVIGVQRLQIRGNRTHGNQLRAFNAADLKFPRLAHIHKQNALAAVQPLLRLGRSYLQIIHAKFLDSIIGWKL